MLQVAQIAKAVRQGAQLVTVQQKSLLKLPKLLGKVLKLSHSMYSPRRLPTLPKLSGKLLKLSHFLSNRRRLCKLPKLSGKVLKLMCRVKSCRLIKVPKLSGKVMRLQPCRYICGRLLRAPKLSANVVKFPQLLKVNSCRLLRLLFFSKAVR